MHLSGVLAANTRAEHRHRSVVALARAADAATITIIRMAATCRRFYRLLTSPAFMTNICGVSLASSASEFYTLRQVFVFRQVNLLGARMPDPQRLRHNIYEDFVLEQYAMILRQHPVIAHVHCYQQSVFSNRPEIEGRSEKLRSFGHAYQIIKLLCKRAEYNGCPQG